MSWELLWRGIILGLSIAAPVGPVGALCIRRTLAEGRASGFVSGLGAATADLFYGSIAALGLTAVSGFLTAQQTWLRLAGGAFLLYLGVRTLLSRPAEQAAQARAGGGLLSAYLTTLGLTLTNPITILAFVSIFAGLGLGSVGAGYGGAGLLIAGVFLGSAGWWLALSLLVGAFRRRIGPRALLWVNRVAGVVILGFGVWALLGLLRPGA